MTGAADHPTPAGGLSAVRCPVHGIPDCSPLLNGCNVPAYVHARDAEYTARLAEAEAQRLAWQRQYEHMKAERDAAIARAHEYERSITWDTTCLNCSSLLDKNYEQYVALDRVRRALDGTGE